MADGRIRLISTADGNQCETIDYKKIAKPRSSLQHITNHSSLLERDKGIVCCYNNDVIPNSKK